jgi:hypothetical protein
MRGYRVRGVDIKEPEFEQMAADDFVVADLRNYSECDKRRACWLPAPADSSDTISSSISSSA